MKKNVVFFLQYWTFKDGFAHIFKHLNNLSHHNGQVWRAFRGPWNCFILFYHNCSSPQSLYFLPLYRQQYNSSLSMYFLYIAHKILKGI